MALQILKACDGAAHGHGHGLGGVVIAVGEDPAGFLAGVGDGCAGDHTVGLTSLAGGDGCIPAQGIEVIGETLICGAGSQDVDVDAHEVAGHIGILKRFEHGIRRNDVVVSERAAGAQAHGHHKNRRDNLLHSNILLLPSGISLPENDPIIRTP